MMRKFGIFFAAAVYLATVTDLPSQPIITPPPFNPLVGVLPTANDVNWNWQNAGLQKIGGIPVRNTQCGLTITPTGITPPQASPPDDFNTLQNAINNANPATCNVILLACQTFVWDQSQALVLNKSLTIRGCACTNASTPYCSTVINVRNGLLPWTGGLCGVSVPTAVACVQTGGAIVVRSPGIGNQFDTGWAGANGNCILDVNSNQSAIGCGTNLDADAAKGDLTIRLHSTTGLSVGQWVLIDEASGAFYQNDALGTAPGLYGQVWAAKDAFNTTSSPATGRVIWGKYKTNTTAGGFQDFCDSSAPASCCSPQPSCQYPYGNHAWALNDRPTAEIHVISAIGGPCPGVNCTITFDDPLMMAYRVSGNTTFTGTISNGSGLAGTTLATTGDNCTTQVAAIVDDATHVIKDGTYITAVNSCTAGVGNYTVNLSQLVASETIVSGAHQAHIYWPTNSSFTQISFLQNAGVENMTIQRAQAGTVNFIYCAYCWAKNMESVNWGGGQSVSGGVFNLDWVARVQIDTSFANNCGNSVNAGGEYPIGIQHATTESYVVNSIIVMCGKGMVGRAGGGNVIAYNYQDKQMYDAFSAIGSKDVDSGINGSHATGTHHNLFEGNWAENIDDDVQHGNEVYHTYFRNWATALRSDFVDPSIPNPATQCASSGGVCTVSDKTPFGGTWSANGGKGWDCPSSTTCTATGTFPLMAAGPQFHDYWNAYVGNVLGTSGITTSANTWHYRGNQQTNISIWMSGWNNDAGNVTVTDPNLNGTNNPQFAFKHGNYDYVTPGIADWTAGVTHALPNSFYLAQRPAFFGPGTTCTYPWPWVTPELGTQINNNSCGNSGLPAKARYDAGTPFVQP